MSRNAPVPVNLRDMIALIDSEKLQQELFLLHAPKLKINWGALAFSRMDRAQQLATALEEFTKTTDGKTQGAALFRQLSTIAIISAESNNSASILDQINSHYELKKRIDSFEWADVPKKGTAILAAFINILAHQEPLPGNDEMEGKHNKKARQIAQSVWSDLIASATSQLNHIKRSPRYDVSEPTISKSDRTTGINNFITEFKKLIREKRNQEKFYVAIADLQSEGQTRYLVKTSPLSHEVMMVNEDHSDANPEPDRAVTAFDVIHDELQNKISISTTTLLPSRTILECFMQHVLGCEFVATRKLSYVKALQPFRGKKGGAVIKLPTENERLGDRVWISSISLSLDGKLLPTTYRGDELNDIYHQMDCQIEAKKFPETKRIVEGMTVKLFLNTTRDGSDQKIATGHSKTYTVRIEGRSFKICGKNGCRNKEHLALFKKLQSDWGFNGMSIEQEKLGTEPIDDLFGNI